MQLLLLCALLVSIASAADYDTEKCTQTFEGATYDLSALKEASGGLFSVEDVDPETHDYMYSFSICGDLPSPPSTWNAATQKYDGTGCVVTSGAGASTLSGASAAFQYAHNEQQSSCWRLNDGWENSSMTLADPADPSAGVTLTYMGGNTCGAPSFNARSLKLTLLCRDDEDRTAQLPGRIDPETGAVEERVREPYNTPCSYEFQVHSGYGCPVECPVKDNRVCGGNGVCGYDQVKKTARCFCNHGRDGADCSKLSAGEGMTADAAALLVVCVLLIAVLGLLGFMYNKLRRVQLDPDAYSQLSHRFNELGQIT